MSRDVIKYIMFGAGALFLIVVVAYLIIAKKNKNSAKHIQQLKQGNKGKGNQGDVIYQKLYIYYKKIPFLNRYVNKMRRRLEIINLNDEYTTRVQASKIITKGLLLVIPLTIIIIVTTKKNPLLMAILLFFEGILVESRMSGMADKIDTKLLKQQIDYFAEVRHAYHEFNMVEEAIYEAAQENDELEVSKQAEKIYEILQSDDPENELEKYYDVAPNSYLKEFAGVSYLTKEFGDRKVDTGSLYLKNLNNITQEMQLEILKRDKIDYVFQSLSIIAALPVICIEPLKSWCVSNFSFTTSFYDGKGGLIAQIALLVLSFICYILIRKVKDNGSIKDAYKDPNTTWQAKAYKNPIIKRIANSFIPKQGTREYRKNIQLLKDAASKQKMETLYINRIVITIITFVVSIFLFGQIHKVAIDYIYNQPYTDYNLISASDTDIKKGMEVTLLDNTYLDKYKGKTGITQDVIRADLKVSKEYKDSSDKDLDEAAKRIFDKLTLVNAESLQWFELLIAILFAALGYYFPIWLLVFQKKMRQLEMENEVMQFHTIIMMLMKIERVNVEMILEWMERYSNIFREPISKCVNNYESGAWEALEELRNDISYKQMEQIVESLQAAVEKIPIADAFDELDTERAYYQEKRKESNERLISKKGLIGKGIGFAPMVVLFVGYLIVPLVAIGLTSMTSSFSTMSTMM